MSSNDLIDEKCMEEALSFIKDAAAKYTLRSWSVKGGSTDIANASNVLIGNIAHDKYNQCINRRAQKEDQGQRR